jgi:hypothetical protein
MKNLEASSAKKQDETVEGKPSGNQAQTTLSTNKEDSSGKRVTFQQVDSFEMDEYLLERTCKETGATEKPNQSDDDFDYDVSDT